ncbi:MAG: methyltransferase [Euryarchaeota archaeon]|nr:methyltransferase [Euryarchaeota archaeon]
MKIEFAGYTFTVRPGVYPPAEDSFLLARHLKPREGERVLDMGTGCGIQGIVASARAAEVVACDINPAAVSCARENCLTNGIENMEVVESDLFDRIGGRFHLIAFNPPYLPTDDREPGDPLTRAWDGGRDGREVTRAFIQGLEGHLEPGGRVLLVQSSLSGHRETLAMLEDAGLETRIIAEERFFFERLYLLEASL